MHLRFNPKPPGPHTVWCSLTLPGLALCPSPPSSPSSSLPCGLTAHPLLMPCSHSWAKTVILAVAWRGHRPLLKLVLLWLVRGQAKLQRKRIDAKDLLHFNAWLLAHIYAKGNNYNNMTLHNRWVCQTRPRKMACMNSSLTCDLPTHSCDTHTAHHTHLSK